jgi:hypothetical protein
MVPGEDKTQSALEKLVQQTAQEGESKLPRDRVDKYRAAISRLIKDIKSWLSSSITSGQVKVHPVRPVGRSEHGHSYTVEAWSFNIGPRYVAVEPRGTWVIGAYGRADLVAQPGGSVVLTLDENFEWYLPTKGRTKITYEKLNETVFAEALRRAFQTPR